MMNSTAIFLTQLVTSLIVFSIAARWVLVPWLSRLSYYPVLMILVAPHAIRHIGLTFMVPSVTSADLHQGFAFTTAWGDYVSAVLAIVSLLALRYRRRWALGSVWVFNVFGTADLLFALSHIEAIPMLGGTWFIPTMLVPVLLVTHFMIFKYLLMGQSQFNNAATE